MRLRVVARLAMQWGTATDAEGLILGCWLSSCLSWWRVLLGRMRSRSSKNENWKAGRFVAKAFFFLRSEKLLREDKHLLMVDSLSQQICVRLEEGMAALQLQMHSEASKEHGFCC